MDKLELKHLAPYLPYGLKAISSCELKMQTSIDDFEIQESKGTVILIELLSDKFCQFEVCSENSLYTSWFNYEVMDSLKPILRPLSDLTKEIEHNSEKFVPTERFYELIDNIDLLDNMFEDIYSKNEILHWPYNVIEKLLEWHFNVFNFPENLYINYNNI